MILGKFRSSVVSMVQAIRIEMKKRADGSYEAGRRSETGTRLDGYKIVAPNPEIFRRAVELAVSDFCPGSKAIIEDNSVGRTPVGGGSNSHHPLRSRTHILA